MILTPQYLAGVADGVVDIFAQAENEILADIARRIIKTGRVTNTAGWQMQKMREAGMLNEDTVKQFAAATNQSEAEIQRMLKESYERALSFDIDVIPADLKMSFSQVMNNPAFRAIMLHGVNNAKQLVSNFTKTTAGAAQTAFFNSLDVSYLQYVTGAQTREEAVRRALKKLAQQGIYKIAYPQQDGGEYQTSVENAVRRALTTAVNQSCAKLQLANCDLLGTDLVETTAHMGARPSHAVWQGKVFSRSGSTSKYPNFEESTGYGTGAGLCGWNCRHSFFPYFEGYSKPAYDMGKFDNEENARLYEIEQKQRRYERMVREAKREVYTLQSGLDAADTAELQEGIANDLQHSKAKLKNRQKLLREHCNKYGLYNDYSRTYTAGYNGRNNMKNNKINIPKTLDNPVKSGIIKAEPVSRYLNSSESLFEYAKKVQPIDGFEDVFIHGDKNGFAIKDKNGIEREYYTPREFANILMQDPNYHGGNIRLFSCEAGADGSVAAKALATQLKVNVLAPSDIVWIDFEGNIIIGPDKYTYSGNWILFTPLVP